MAKKRTYRKFGPIPEEWGGFSDDLIYYDEKGKRHVEKRNSKNKNKTKTITKEHK